MAGRDECLGSRRSVAQDGFLQHRFAQYLGARFTGDDVNDAAGWLHRNGLIEGVTVDQLDGPVGAHLTDTGEKCAEDYDYDPRAYLASMERRDQQRPGVSLRFGDVTGGTVQVAGRDGTQTTDSSVVRR